MHASLILTLLAGATASSTAGPMSSTAPHGTPPSAADLAANLKTDAALRGTIGALLQSPQWQAQDPTWHVATSHTTRAWKFGEARIVRLSPLLPGPQSPSSQAASGEGLSGATDIPVEGADRIIRLRGYEVVSFRAEGPLHPTGHFVLSEADALTRAADAVPGNLFSGNKDRLKFSFDEIRGFARAVWLRRGENLRPAWRVRMPGLTLQQLRDVWIDAESGAVLMSSPVARFAAAPVAAKVFDWAPDPLGVDAGDLVDVELDDLAPAAIGDHLKGFHFETFNCCKRYTCPGDATSCEPEARICAADDAAEPAIASTIDINLPASSIPFDLSTFGFTGDTVYVKSVFCTERPRLVSTSGPDGWFPTPVDASRALGMTDGLASETDAFAELQLYWATQTYFEHVRAIMGAPEFCLRDQAMQCVASDGSAVLDDQGQPVHPFHITANLLFPEFDLTPSLTNPLLIQFLSGAGVTPENPIVIEDYGRMANAAFIPALEGAPVQVPPGLESIANQFNRSYDSNVYFQGDRDFGYDGEIIFHEFTHALVGTLVPQLHSLGVDTWGSHYEPGSMNEGWSDYFSASYTNDSVTGNYAGRNIGGGGETGIRDIQNTAVCPDDFIGEVHADSLPFSGALWDVRTAVVDAGMQQAGIDALDQLLISTIAESDDDETMARQTQRIVDALTASSVFDASIVAAAEAAFDAHGVRACERIWPLNSISDDGSILYNNMPMLMQPAPGDVGLSNGAPSVMQFRIDVPAAVGSFQIKWEQAGGGIFGGGGSAGPVAAAYTETTPLSWRYEGAAAAIATPYNATGRALAFDATAAGNQAEMTASANGQSTDAVYTALFAPGCEQRTFFVTLLSRESGSTMTDIRAVLSDPTDACDPEEEDEGCGCAQSSNGMLIPGLLLAVFAWRRRSFTRHQA